jgi:hypothetical protein
MKKGGTPIVHGTRAPWEEPSAQSWETLLTAAAAAGPVGWPSEPKRAHTMRRVGFILHQQGLDTTTPKSMFQMKP